MTMYWRPGLRVWWRSDGEAQLGQDPPIIMVGLSRADHALLDALATADPQLDCWTTALRLGWNREDFTHFMTRLPPQAIVNSPTVQANPVLRYWSVAETSGAPHSTLRFSAEIIVDGVGPLGMRVTDAVCRAGIDSIFLTDPHPVVAHDVQPGAFLTDDVGHPRGLAAMRRLRPRHPMARIQSDPHPAYLPTVVSDPEEPALLSPRGELYAPRLRRAHHPPLSEQPRADLVIAIAYGALPAYRVRQYEQQETPILPVVVRELDIVIGPILSPAGLCLRCIHLALADEDPRWPVLATQMAAESNPGIDPIVMEVAAAIAAHQIIAFVDQRPTALVGASLHVDGIHPVPRVQRWEAHADCGCQLDHLAA